MSNDHGAIKQKSPRCGAIDITSFSSCRSCGAKYSDRPIRPAMEYAGFLMRVIAYLIDGIVMVVIAFFIAMLVPSSLTSVIPDSDIIWGVKKSVLTFVLLPVGWLYYALLEGSPSQATFGKMVVGIRVTDLDGNQISFLRASGRYFGMILSGLILNIGYLMPLFTEKKQVHHDMIAGCLVVSK